MRLTLADNDGKVISTWKICDKNEYAAMAEGERRDVLCLKEDISKQGIFIVGHIGHEIHNAITMAIESGVK